MARSKNEILATEAMLQRLCAIGISREHAEALRRISMTLHRWHEHECNEDIVRGKHGPAGGFVHDDNGTLFVCVHGQRAGQPNRYYPIADRERGALKRLASIMKHYPTLTPYVQGDPRGCALYILRPGDVPAGCDAGSYYSRGLAVHQ